MDGGARCDAVGSEGALSAPSGARDHENAAATTTKATTEAARRVGVFDATAAKVTGKGEPAEDVPEVQRVMQSDRVLDVKKYPTITFESRSVSRAASSGAAMTLRIEGDLMLHGMTRRVTAQGVQVRTEGDRLTAEGKLGPVGRLMPTATATTVRRGAEMLVVDGPFAETKEQLLGFYIVNCETLQDAIDAARQLTAPRRAAGLPGALEIRPLAAYFPAGA